MSNHTPIPETGAAGGSDIASSIRKGIVSIGDAAVFNAFQGSNLHSLRDGIPTYLVYPEDMHSNPTKGNVIHFDIFYKSPATMEDVVSKVWDNPDDNPSSAAAYAQLDAAQKSLIESKNATISEMNKLLGGLGEAVGASTAGDSEDEVTESTRLGMAKEKSLDKVTLFMPTGIQNTDTLTYSEQNFAMVKAVLDMEVGALLPGAMGAAAGFVDGLGSMIGVELNSEAALNAVTGVVTNPRKEQLFNDVQFRTFEFAFNFFPKSKEESDRVRDIIKMFRFHAHPEVSSNQVFYNMPSEFQITYVDIKHPTNNPYQLINNAFFGGVADDNIASPNTWLNKIGRCALTSVVTDYTPLGKLTSFANGAPAAITLTLSFAELEAINRNMVKVGY